MPGDLRPQLQRLDVDRAGDAALGQHRLRAAHARRDARGGREDGAQARRSLAPRRERRVRARRSGSARWRCRRSTWPLPTRRSRRAASTPSRRRSARSSCRTARTRAGASRSARRVISDGVAYEVTRILEENIQYGTGTGAAYGQDAAGKTGTTEEHSDAWFCGYTPRLATTVWVGYPKAKIPMDERARDLRLRRQLPGRHLAPVHELGDRPARLGLVPRADATGPSGRRSSAGTFGRSFGYTDDDDDDDDDDSGYVAPPPPPRRRPPPPPPPAAAAEPRPSRRRRRRRRSRLRRRRLPTAGRRSVRAISPDPARRTRRRAAAIALLVAGCVACAWVAGAPLVPSDAGRAGDGRRRRRGSSWRCWSLAFRVYARRRSGSLRRRGAAWRAVARPRGRDPARAARGAAAALDRRLDVLGVRADRGGARRQPVRRHAERVPGRSGVRPTPGAAWRDTTSVYGPAFTLRLGRRGAASPARPPRRRRGSSRRSPRSPCSRAPLLAARLARDRPFALAFVGWNPLLAIHFAGGGHNDALMMALVLAALALAAAGRRGLAGVAWAPSIFVKWVPVVFLAPARRSRRARAAAASATSASRSPPSARRRLATLRYGLDWLRAFGPLARNAEGQTSYALPHRRRAARRAARRSRSALAGARARCRRSSGWRARRGAAAPYLGLRRLPAARDDAVARALVHDLGAAARGRRRGPARAARSRSASAPTCCRRRSRSSAAGRRGCRPRRRRAGSAGRARARASGCACARGLEAVEVGRAASRRRRPTPPPRAAGS